jgi:hypothetical protein
MSPNICNPCLRSIHPFPKGGSGDVLLTFRASPFIVDGSEDTMKKALSFLALVLLIASFAAAQNWFKGSLDQAVAKAKSENKRVLLDFYSGG